MMLLFESAFGYALFKVLDEDRLKLVDNLVAEFENPLKVNKILQLKYFQQFDDVKDALVATTACVEGKLTKSLRKVLQKQLLDEKQLMVVDSKLGQAIKEKFDIKCISNNAVSELVRCIRNQTDVFFKNVLPKQKTALELGLAHSLSRYKLKFTPDKVDTMIVQSINLIEEMDTQLNNYVMRCREWYNWHFPELNAILTDNIQFVKTVKIIGTRDNMKNTDLSDVMPEELEEQIKEISEMSIGIPISDEDLQHIWNLCDDILELTEYRENLYNYMKARLMSVAPNTSVLLGELVAAKLISRAGSLLNLAKHPASTVQILGSEKALFRALKSKMETPKYGYIYSCPMIGQTGTPFKGKMARMLAAKVSLATRVDALGDDPGMALGIEHKAKLELKLREMEEGSLRRISGSAKAKAKFEKYRVKKEVHEYPVAGDSTLKRKLIEEIGEDGQPIKKIKLEPGVGGNSDGDGGSDEISARKKNKKKRKSESEPEAAEMEPVEGEGVEVEKDSGDVETGAKKKRKKKKKKNLGFEQVLAGMTELEDEGMMEAGEEVVKKKKDNKKKKNSGVISTDAEVVEPVVREPTSDIGTGKKKKNRKKTLGIVGELEKVPQDPPQETSGKKKKK